MYELSLVFFVLYMLIIGGEWLVLLALNMMFPVRRHTMAIELQVLFWLLPLISSTVAYYALSRSEDMLYAVSALGAMLSFASAYVGMRLTKHKKVNYLLQAYGMLMSSAFILLIAFMSFIESIDFGEWI